jgi:hypothetical protein
MRKWSRNLAIAAVTPVLVFALTAMPARSEARSVHLGGGQLITTFSDEEMAALEKSACAMGSWRKKNGGLLEDSPSGWLESFAYKGRGAAPPRGWSEERLSGIVSIPVPPDALVAVAPNAIELRLPFGEAFAYAHITLEAIPRGAKVRSDGGLVQGHREFLPLDRKYWDAASLLADEVQARESPYHFRGLGGKCAIGSGLATWLGRPAYRNYVTGLYYLHTSLRTVVRVGKQNKLLSAEIYGTTAPFAQHMYTLWHVMHGVQVRDGLRPAVLGVARILGMNGYPGPLPAPHATLTGLSPSSPFKKPKPRS